MDLLVAFGILHGNSPTKEQLVNECIHTYFLRVYDEYCSNAETNDLVKRMMEESI